MSPPIFEKLVLTYVEQKESESTNTSYLLQALLLVFQLKGRVSVKTISLLGDKLDHRNQKLPYRGK